MKKAVRIVAITLILVLALSFAACGKKAEPEPEPVVTNKATIQDLYGTWKGIGGEISTVSFSKDGNYKDDAGDNLYIIGTYTVDEDAQTITVNESEYGMVFVYNYTIDGNKLTLQMDGGLPRSFTK